MKNLKLSRGARLTLLLVLVLFAWCSGGMLYFFALPTDGWLAAPPDNFGESGYIYKENLMGAPSALQPNDRVIAVNGIPLQNQDLTALAPQWVVGGSAQYTVLRSGTQLNIEVPLVQWQAEAAVRYWIWQSTGFGLIGIVLFFAIAALAFFKRPDDHAARALLVFSTLFLVLTPLTQTSQSSPTVLVFALLNAICIVTILAAYSVLFPPVLLNLALVFPRPKPIVLRHPFLEYVAYPIGLIVVAAFVLQLYLVGYAWTIFSIVGAIALVLHSAFTMRDALSRAQLLWGLWGFVIGLTMFLSTYLVLFGIVPATWTDFINIIVDMSFSVLGITLAIAILRYRLFDIGIIIRRTVTYAIVVALLLAVYFGSVILLQQIFASVTGQRSEIITIVSTLAIAALFVPLRNRVQNAIDKRFNRNKYNAQQVLQKFAVTVRDETDLDRLSAEMLNVVNETMQPKNVSLWLKKDSKK